MRVKSEHWLQSGQLLTQRGRERKLAGQALSCTCTWRFLHPDCAADEQRSGAGPRHDPHTSTINRTVTPATDTMMRVFNFTRVLPRVSLLRNGVQARLQSTGSVAPQPPTGGTTGAAAAAPTPDTNPQTAASDGASSSSAPHHVCPTHHVATSSPMGLTSGAPDTFIRRTCRIYRPSRSPTQQEPPELRWKIEFDTPGKWVNPLMGWTSSRDTVQQLREQLYFTTREQAIEFAEREGFDWTAMPYHDRKFKPKAFADNFKWKGAPK